MFVSGFPSLLLSSALCRCVPTQQPAGVVLLPPAAGAQFQSEVRPTGPPLPPPPSRFPSNTLPPLCTPASLDHPARVFPPVWHSARSVWTPSRRKNLSGGAQLGLCRGRKEGLWCFGGGGLRVFRRSGSAVGAPLSQTSERAPSGRSGGWIYITHADAGKH